MAKWLFLPWHWIKVQSNPLPYIRFCIISNALFYYFSSRDALSYEFIKAGERCIGSTRPKNNVWTLWHLLWAFAPFARPRPFDPPKKINQKFEPGCHWFQVRALILRNVQNAFDSKSRPLTGSTESKKHGPTNALWHQSTENLLVARFVFIISNWKCMHAYEWSCDHRMRTRLR